MQKGDCVYLFTDDYSDQFGGQKVGTNEGLFRHGKKFKFKRLEEKLLEVNSFSISQQRDILECMFDDWKGNLEQVDDVLITGIKI